GPRRLFDGGPPGGARRSGTVILAIGAHRLARTKNIALGLRHNARGANARSPASALHDHETGISGLRRSPDAVPL
ncbi:hypothetical protein, partial [Streptomyces sp. NPDC002922]|uniref:hypothetical protein n=1 Tax=Streptomyces sp. NPDC002922 TaxID=3154439 RepID=UPI0033A89EC0